MLSLTFHNIFKNEKKINEGNPEDKMFQQFHCGKLN